MTALSSVEQTLEWVRRLQLVMEASAPPGVPSFVEAVAGGPVKGSWWAHPLGKRMYVLSEAVADSGEVMVVKLLGGKRTWIHRDSWPLVLRVVLDKEWRAERLARVNAEAAGQFQRIEKAGRVRAPPPAPTTALEKRMLVHVASEHSPSGRHVKVATAWNAWASAVGADGAGADLSLAEALAGLNKLAAGHPTALN